MKRLPDFDVELAQAMNFILGSSLAQRAFEKPPFRNYVNIVQELITALDRLADNCHMPEFTNHALPHVCSIVQRASAWGVNDSWLQALSAQEAGYLLLALIIHDLGMLSQEPRDLPDAEQISSRKGMSDLPTWVRRTHVIRLPKLTRRLLSPYILKDPDLELHLNVIVQIAASHSAWPWESKYKHNQQKTDELGLSVARLQGLNAVVAVTDLLDEDSSRCDTATLIRHKHGSNLNIAHWIRHSLTAYVEDVRNQSVRVRFRQIPNVPEDFNIVYRVLRNHYRLVRFYESDLDSITAAIKDVEFESSRILGMQKDDISEEMRIWSENLDFKYCLIPRLLDTFEAEAKNLAPAESETRCRLNQIGIENVNLRPYEEFLVPSLPTTDEERIMLQIKR